MNVMDIVRRLSKQRLSDFKSTKCDENLLIAEILKTRLSERLTAPILDVGSGLGDIALSAFPDKPSVLLDCEDHAGSKISSCHERVVSDFFRFVSNNSRQFGTLLFVHVLQYLDEDVERLFEAVSALRPSTIVTVTNDNTGTFGDFISWASSNIAEANPERHIDFGLMGRFSLEQQVPFVATLSYPDFGLMADDLVTVILDASSESRSSVEAAEGWLRHRLRRPQLEIAQTVRYYEAHG